MELSAESCENYRILVSALVGNEVTIDVLMIEDILLKEFIDLEYIRRIDDLISISDSEYPTAISNIVYHNNSLYAAPVALDAGIMYYRNDLTSGDMDYRRLADENNIRCSVKMTDGEDMLTVMRECINLEGDTVKGMELYKKLYSKTDTNDKDAVQAFKSGGTAYVRA